MGSESFITELLVRFSQANENRIAFSLYDGKQKKEITYAQFAKDILKTAGCFKEKGIYGQNIVVLSDSCYELFVTFFAIIVSGNIAVIVNPYLPEEMLQWQCEKADATIVCNLMPENTQNIIGVRHLNYEDMQIAAPLHLNEVHSADPNETVLLMFTSGTTGKSKAVEITSDNLRNSALGTKELRNVPGMDVTYHATPRYHIAGIRSAIGCFQQLNTLRIGRGMRYLFMDLPVFNPKTIVVVPAIAENLVKILKRSTSPAERQKYIGTQLQRICVGGAALKPSTTRYLREQGFIVDTVWAMTETTGLGTWCILDEDNIRSIGKPYGQMQCRIQDGELLITGPTVMKGYYKDPEETAKILIDGWIHTGDLGYCDEKGYFYLTGRKKNIIILSNGENVCPEEIEEALGDCEEILECMVYSDGKGICADIYTTAENTAADYIKQYNESVPLYRQVYKVNYTRSPLEKTGSGKIKRKENIYE